MWETSKGGVARGGDVGVGRREGGRKGGILKLSLFQIRPPRRVHLRVQGEAQ